jgi:predicted ATPase
VTLIDLGSARLRDLASSEHIYQVAHPQLQRDFPALRSLEATPNNLPQQVTSFIGRERELADVKGLLGKTRLLTLVGAGGIGKTRLSLQAAADAMDDFPDGVWFVELALLTDAQRVPQAVASVLGVKEEAGRPVIEALLKHLKNRQLLLVLDNCEHLVQACAELVSQVVQAAPKLKVLASSRERLRTAGEQIYGVPTLSLPEAHRTLTAESLMQFEAARLFIERAVAAQPAFEVTDRNAAAITAICLRLDGIPLALELAAARVRALPVDALAARLGDRFRLLGGGDRAALPRQQTLRALIDWSYDLLTEAERTVLRRLAVFAGGWTLEAAEAVAAAGDVNESDVLDLLTRLVEKSLVVMEPTGGRYRLLDTVREYAQQRLEESGEGDAAYHRHLAFYLAFAEKARPELVGAQQGAWLALLDIEHENLLAAHARAGGEAGLRLVYAVSTYWLNRGLLGLGHRVMVEALVRARDPSPARCRALFDAGNLCCFMARYEEAQEYLGESLAIARETADRRMVAMVLQPLGLASMGQGKLEAARGYLEEALALARELGDKRELAAALNAAAQLARLQGKLDAAEPLYGDVVALARELEDRESIAIGLLNLAMVSVGRGVVDRARSMLLEVIAIAEETGSKPVGQSVLEVSAGLAASLEEWACAARFYYFAEAQMGETGLHRDPADEAFLAPLMEKTRKALGAAAFAEAQRGGRTLSYEDTLADVREWLSRRS